MEAAQADLLLQLWLEPGSGDAQGQAPRGPYLRRFLAHLVYNNRNASMHIPPPGLSDVTCLVSAAFALLRLMNEQVGGGGGGGGRWWCWWMVVGGGGEATSAEGWGLGPSCMSPVDQPPRCLRPVHAPCCCGVPPAGVGGAALGALAALGPADYFPAGGWWWWWGGVGWGVDAASAVAAMCRKVWKRGGCGGVAGGGSGGSTSPRPVWPSSN